MDRLDNANTQTHVYYAVARVSYPINYIHLHLFVCVSLDRCKVTIDRIDV